MELLEEDLLTLLSKHCICLLGSSVPVLYDARMSVIILRNELLLLCGVVHIVRESNRSQQTTKKKKHVLCVILLLLASSSSRADGYCLLDVMMG